MMVIMLAVCVQNTHRQNLQRCIQAKEREVMSLKQDLWQTERRHKECISTRSDKISRGHMRMPSAGVHFPGS